MQVTNAAARPDWLAALRERARGLPIEILGESFERVGIEALLGSSDALVSLHRSEGLGLLPIEAMYLAKPVVATAYGGVTDYLDQRTGFPIGFSLTRVGSELGPYPARAVWAEPNVVEATEAMRRILAEPVEAGQRAAAGARRVRELYSVEATATRYAGELRRIHDSPRTAGRAPGSHPFRLPGGYRRRFRRLVRGGPLTHVAAFQQTPAQRSPSPRDRTDVRRAAFAPFLIRPFRLRRSHHRGAFRSRSRKRRRASVDL